MIQIDKAINDFDMLKNSGKIIVGLSGGADSVTLIHYLKYCLNREVVACHINHNLRGEESLRDMQFVVEFCKTHDIPLFIKDTDVKGYSAKNSVTIEEAGRAIRYDFFGETLLSQKADYIATAHTLSDNAETVLLNLTRGTGLGGLCGIPPVRGMIIRPLIYCTRQDIENYCEKNNLEYVVDSTNKDSNYSRNNIRNNVIPVLKQINESFETAILRNVKILRNDQHCLQQIAKVVMDESKDVKGYQVDRILSEHEAIRHRVISIILDENAIQKSADLILHIDGIIKATRGKINVSAGKYIEVKNNLLSVTVEEDLIDYFEDELILGEYTSKANEKYKISKCEAKSIDFTKKFYKNLLYILLDYDKIKGTAVIRQRKQFDTIEFVNRVGTRTLKKLFIEQKLSGYEKSKVLVFSDEDGVIAVFSQGVSKRVAVDEKTKTVLLIEKIK
ncbi:MAG: tRNA lysidine(34) synthetase TilS [Oscillospiraceae bacterium]